MSDIIRLLPDHVANQIAAGEVIQRPASAVKELLENAIDARATEIKLLIKDAGKTLVQVIDNGIGMSITDARMAFERHATSKIQKAEDLFHLQTKGFRGEALASIVAIAHVEMQTKRPEDELGTEIHIEGSKITRQEPCVCPAGTSIAMKNLFFNIPARRNFLKSDTVEFRHILDEFHRVALAHPAIHFYLYNNGNELFNLPATNFRQRIVHLFGGKTNEKLVPIIAEDTPLVKISGFIVKPEYLAKTKNLQFLMVNHRFVKNQYLNHAITAAYEGLIHADQKPEYFISLEVDPATIDINIHPTKTEIKFEEEHGIYALLKSAVKHSLGQFNIAPTLDFSKDPTFDIPYNYKDKAPEFPRIQVDPNFNPFKEEYESRSSSRSSSNFGNYPKKTASWESLYTGIESAIDTSASETIVSSLFEAEPTKNQGKKIIALAKKYLVTTLGGELIIINCNRAHQRILFEDFMKNLQSSHTAVQQLMFPYELPFAPHELEVITQLRDLFESSGFMFAIESDKVVVSGIPLHLTDSEIPNIFNELLQQHIEALPTTENTQKEAFAKALCKSLAVKTGQVLSEEEQETLINNLFSCQEVLISPFGKRIYYSLSTNEIDNLIH